MLALLVALSVAWAGDQADISVDQPPTPKADCVGNPDDPVAAIYLHGLFRGKGAYEYVGDPKWKALEVANREKLKKFAEENHIRIALPLARKITEFGSQRWEIMHDDMDSIKGAAMDACKVKKLDGLNCIMGFSRGGNYLKEMADKSCSQFGNAKVVAFGVENYWPNSPKAGDLRTKEELPPRGCDGNFRIINSDHNNFVEFCNLGQLCGLKPQPKCQSRGSVYDAEVRDGNSGK